MTFTYAAVSGRVVCCSRIESHTSFFVGEVDRCCTGSSHTSFGGGVVPWHHGIKLYTTFGGEELKRTRRTFPHAFGERRPGNACHSNKFIHSYRPCLVFECKEHALDTGVQCSCAPWCSASHVMDKVNWACVDVVISFSILVRVEV